MPPGIMHIFLGWISSAPDMTSLALQRSLLLGYFAAVWAIGQYGKGD
jgi:hypothetical protein